MVGGTCCGILDSQLLRVLILVVMEYGRWGLLRYLGFSATACLNPCCNGIWSVGTLRWRLTAFNYGLNPCCNGIWSVGTQSYPPYQNITGLNPCCNGIWSVGTNNLGHKIQIEPSLNPCCNGIWSVGI